MANYLSRPYSPQQPVSRGNINLDMTVLNTLQSRYDANKAIVDQAMSQYEMLKGLRETDNSYIAAKVAEAKAQIDKFGNMRFEHKSSVDTVMSTLKNVLEDPIVKDAIQSRASYEQYNAEVSKLKEKNPEKYNDANYQFGLYQGGFNDYMQGKSNKLGSMSYTPYTDVSANYTKRLKEYVDQYDDEQYLGQENKGKYHTVDVYGKRVLKEDLEVFLRQTTTADEASQLKINAFMKFKDLKDTDVSNLLKPVYSSKLEGLKEKEADLKAKADSGDADANKELKSVQESITNIKSKIDSNNFTKDELYSTYNSQIISDFASLYDKNVITKKDVQNYLFDEIKFETEQKRWALTFDQKEREIALKEKEVGLQQSIVNGTLTDYADETKDKEVSSFQTAVSDKNQLFNTIAKEMTTLDPSFASMDTKQKAQYIASLNLGDVTKIKNKNISPELRNSITQWQNMNENVANFYSDNLKKVQPTIIGSFNDMQNSYFNDKNSQLALDKVANYLPITAKVIKDAKSKGKQLTWADIPEDYRYAIQVEFLAQYRREGDLNDDQLKVFSTNEYLMKNKIKDKNIVNSLNTKDKEIGEEKGYFEEGWDAIKELGRFSKAVVSDVGASLMMIPNTIKEGSDYANREYDKYTARSMKEYNPNLKNLTGLLNLNPAFASSILVSKSGIFSEEENLRNIESRDLLGRQNIAERFDSYKTGLDMELKNKFDVESPNQRYRKAVSYSTNIKEQKQTAELLRQTILASVPDAEIPSGDNFTVKQSGSGYEVTYQVKTNKGLVTSEPVYLDKLPEQIQNTFQQKQDEWQKSIYNPNFKIPSFSFETPKTTNEAEEIINNLAVYGELDSNIVEQLYTSGLLLPVDTYLDNYVSEDIQSRNAQAIQNFKNQSYKTDTKIINNNLYSTITYKDIISGKQIQTKPEPHRVFNEQVESVDIQLSLLRRVDKLKQEQLAKLK